MDPHGVYSAALLAASAGEIFAALVVCAKHSASSAPERNSPQIPSGRQCTQPSGPQPVAEADNRKTGSVTTVGET